MDILTTLSSAQAAIIAAGFVIGVVVGILAMLVFGKKETKKIKRQLERVSVGADDSGLRVKTLENKIETLEIALKKALEDK